MFGESYAEEGASNAAHPCGVEKGGKGGCSVITSAGAAPDGRGQQPQRPHSVREIIKELDEEQDVSGPKGGCCSRLFIPFLTVAMLILIFGAILYTNGTGSDVEAAPRVAMIVVEGFSGVTFHSLMRSSVYLPNIAYLLSSQKGEWVQCATGAESSCARAVGVESPTSGGLYVNAAAAMTSCFSGVTPSEHRVYNESLESMSTYATTSKVYPSIAKRVRDAGMGVTVVGTSLLINSFSSESGRCSLPGVLDMECAASQDELLQSSKDEYSGNVQLDCLSASSCSANARYINIPTDPTHCSKGHAEAQFTRHLKKIFGGLAYSSPTQETPTQDAVAENLSDSLFIFHFDALAVRARSDHLPNFELSVSSKEFVAQAHMLDALIGQVISYVRDRSRSEKESWLILGVSNHGGSGKQHNPSSQVSSENTVPFFLATYTANRKRYVSMAPFQRPVTQLDVLPTVLTWLGVAPYDTETNAVIAGTNTSAASPLVWGRVLERQRLTGFVQGICSSGLSLKDCAV